MLWGRAVGIKFTAKLIAILAAEMQQCTCLSHKLCGVCLPLTHMLLSSPLCTLCLQGCGIVRFQSSAAAAAAKAALHDKYKWASDYAPMVLERVNEKKKRSNISSGGEFASVCAVRRSG